MPSKAGMPTCVLDQRIVNKKTLTQMDDMGLSFFATLCGMNRGAFVLDPTDGHTWGCTAFPPNFAQLAGADDTNITIKDANAIKETYQMHNVTAHDTVLFLDYLIKLVYHSTNDKDKDPYACSVSGLAELQCEPVNALPKIRSVTLAGLFVPAPWATNGKTLSLHQAKKFYTPSDFTDMADLGLNTVQIPVPVMAFVEEDSQVLPVLADILAMARDASLQAILLLAGEDNDDAVAAAAHYAAQHDDVVLGLLLPSAQSLTAARAAQPALPLLVPVNQGQLKDLVVPDANVFAALDMDHASSVGDIASSTSLDDRNKLFYHEAIACVARSPLEYTACWRRIPVFVYKGFDLSIDDCINRRDNPDKFVDYGQCNRLNETIGSDWWHRHRRSFAERQLFSFEQSLGWSYAAWKLYEDAPGDKIDSFALMSLKSVAGFGLFPSLKHEPVAIDACLNPPVADFVLGDETLAPTAAPAPECPDNGWWNYTMNACEYWVPPTPATKVPSPAPPIECPTPWKNLVEAAAGGALVALLLGAGLLKLFGNRRRQEGYTPVPSASV